MEVKNKVAVQLIYAQSNFVLFSGRINFYNIVTDMFKCLKIYCKIYANIEISLKLLI